LHAYSTGALSARVPLRSGRDLTPVGLALSHCIRELGFVRDRATPIAEWVTWAGGDPDIVLLVLIETLHAIAEGLGGDDAQSERDS
jgi:hypothetical protein